LQLRPRKTLDLRSRTHRAARTCGTGFAPIHVMHAIEPTRRDDLILAALLLIIGVPRAFRALFYETPIGAEGSVSLACVVLALLILIRRNATRRR
jgi:hypothetical protein